MKKVGIYIRVSSENQARIQDGSLVSQKQRLEEYLRARNLVQPGWGEICGTYVDEARSGKDTNRAQFQAMLKDIQRKKIDTILVSELSRLSRSRKDFCVVWDFFKAHGAQFLSLREQFDTTTAAGEMMIFSIMNFAQFERMQTSERVSANFQARATRGLYNGGVTPFGFSQNPERKGILLIDENEAKDVRKIFETYHSTGSIQVTLTAIQKMGITTKRRTLIDGRTAGGNDFCINSLINLLRNRHYIGEREINKRYKGISKEDAPTGKEYRTSEAAWPAIVEKSIFNQVQRMLDDNVSRYRVDSRKTFDYFFSSLVFCPECGDALVGSGGTSKTGEKHVYYAHKGAKVTCKLKRIPANKLHDFVLSRVKTLAKDEEYIAHLYNDAQSSDKKHLPELLQSIARVDAKMGVFQKEIARLIEMNHDFGSKTVMTKIMENEAKLETLRIERLTLEAQKVDANPDDLAPSSEFKKILETLSRDIYKLEPPKRRRLLKALIGRVELRHPNQMLIKLNYDKGSIALVQEYLRNSQTLKTKKDGAKASSYFSKIAQPSNLIMSSYELHNGGEKEIRTLEGISPLHP